MAELLSVPLKKSSDVDIVKPLKNLLQATYSSADNNEDYSEALAELARLRTNAIWKVFEKSSLEGIYSYYDQLVCLQNKIPPQEVQIPFKWKDAFDKGSIFGGRMSLTISSLAYEQVCILFNMAAMQSVMAAQQPLDTEDSLKLAAKLLQQAAGIFAHLKANVMMAVHQETTPDLNPETLAALSQLMLAQAQEAIAYKCIRDEMKESMVAKVCAHAEELYTDALRAMGKETLKSLWEREWLPALAAKQALFRGLAQFYQSLVCRAGKAVGEEIARLQLAVEQLKAAGGAGGEAVREVAARAQRHLAEALKDNDFIYHERVPDAKLLEPIARAPVAKPLPLAERWAPASRDLFERLVPLAVHQAMQASAARRDELVSAEINRLRDATQLLNSIMASLNLPACIEGVGGGGLPESIREKAAAVRAAGGTSALRRLAAELPELLQRNKDILDEAKRMLREEAEADAALRAQFGARWTRTESAKLTEAFHANADKYAQIVDNAMRADDIVQNKLRQHERGIELLSGSEGALAAGVPEAAEGEGAGAGGAAEATLRSLVAEVEALKAERDALEAELRDATLDLRARFEAALAADGALDEPALSAGALGAALAPLQRRVTASLERQEALAARLQQAHAALASSRGGASGRDAALGQLCSAHDAYLDLTANLKEGVKFYNDLTQLLVAFQNKVSDFCFARKTEKDELLKDLTQEASRNREPPPRPAPPVPTPAVSQPQQPPAALPYSSQPQQPPAALPYPSQPQGMPLPYAAAGTAPYPYYAPLPAGYNPYATLPYPHHAPRPPYSAPYAYPPPAGYNPYPPPQ